MASAIPDASKMSERVQKTEDAQVRAIIRRAIRGQYDTMSTTVNVPASNSAAVAAELAARGYTAAYADGEWSITWTNAANVPDSNIGQQFERADVAKEKCMKNGKMYISDTIVASIRSAAARQERTVTVTLPDNAAVRANLTAKGYTVNHDGTDWTVSF